MEAEVAPRLLPFQLQFDKPVPSQIKIAEWNPEKDLLAMVTEDSKILLHRFNWQRLWIISPGRSIISLCWRPDGKTLAVGLEDGTISLHDVENGNLLRSMKCHRAAVMCLYWQEDLQDICNGVSNFEDRTPRFFPPPPRIPRMAGVVSGDTGFMDDASDSFQGLSNSFGQRFNILCSGDKEGCICFSVFGIFPIAKIDVNKLSISISDTDNKATYRMLNASVCKVALSKDFCHMTVMCAGELLENHIQGTQMEMPIFGLNGLNCLVIRTSILHQKKFELHQMALQASNIENLNEVIKASLSVMNKQWSDAMHAYHQRFDSFSMLISVQGLDSCPQEEFLSLLGGARMSPTLHQFLSNSLGEAGVRRVSKAVCGTGKELQLIVLDHLQPAVELLGFRIGELRGLSKWHARYGSIGLDEVLMNDATEKAGMLLVQLERFMRVLSSAIHQFSNFFTWLQKCIKLLVSEQVDPPLSFNSELVVIFLRTLYDQDPVKQLLETSPDGQHIEVDLETVDRVRELVHFGGFLDTDYLKRTLAEEFQLMESSLKEAFLMPITAISEKLLCIDLLPLFPLPSLPFCVPSTHAYYKDIALDVSVNQVKLLDHMSFRIPDESLPCAGSCIAVVRGFVHDSDCVENGSCSLDAVLLRIPHGYTCVELAFYREGQLVLLLDQVPMPECSGTSRIMIMQTSGLPFSPLSPLPVLTRWAMHELKEFIIDVALESEKGRPIPYSVVPPLAVSASRGVACVFAAKKRALVYILEEDEEVPHEEV